MNFTTDIFTENFNLSAIWFDFFYKKEYLLADKNGSFEVRGYNLNLTIH